MRRSPPCAGVRPDLVLSDVMMPQLDGFGLLGEIRRDPALQKVPVVLVSARAGEEAKIEGLDAGADDYLVKPFAARELLARVSANLKMAQLRTEIAQELRARTTELETVLETVPTAVWFTYDRDASTVWGNRLAGRLLRVPQGNPPLTAPQSERPHHFRLLRDGVALDATMQPLQRAARGEDVPSEELEVAFDDGTSVFLLIQAKPLRDADDRPIGAVGAAVDITDRRMAERAVQQLNETLELRVQERTNELAAANRQLLTELEERERVEETLRQMQRLEAIGQLTSGVAHDFNNLLTVVLGNIGFLERGLPAMDEKLSLRLGYMRTAAERGATLTAQLLAFSRRQRLEPKPVDLNTAVGGMRDLLQSTMGGTVRIETVLRPELWPALVDPAQIELVVLNLAINARDAMQVGGTVTIETDNAILGAPQRPEEPAAGEYVMVAVTDTGSGMSEVIRAKAFEPFFTTKEIGKGSGLGLSQVLGFAKQSGGGVGIDTRVGEGSSVRVYLPRATAAVSSLAGRGLDGRSQPAVIATATVLVVDDDDGVREVTASTLRDAGYTVHEAGSGGAALELLEHSQRIDVVLVDFAMPGMNGSELARHIRGKFPPLQILFVTGYADTQALAEVGEDNIIRKPFLEGELERKVRMALARQLVAGPDGRRRAAGT